MSDVCIASPSKKRIRDHIDIDSEIRLHKDKRTTGTAAHNDEEIVFNKVLAALYLHKPSTKAELERLVSSYCCVQLTVDVKVVLYHLLLNHVILCTNDNHILPNPNYNPSKPLTAYLPVEMAPKDGTEPEFSSDFKKALDDSVHWIGTSLSVPTNLNEFVECLQGLCTVKYRASAESIVQSLLKRQYISFDSLSQVRYFFPCAMKLVHFSVASEPSVGV